MSLMVLSGVCLLAGGLTLYAHWRFERERHGRAVVFRLPLAFGLMGLGVCLGGQALGGEAGIAMALSALMVIGLGLVVRHALGLPSPRSSRTPPTKEKASAEGAKRFLLTAPTRKQVKKAVGVVVLAPLVSLWLGCLVYGLPLSSEMDRYVLMMATTVGVLPLLWVWVLRA